MRKAALTGQRLLQATLTIRTTYKGGVKAANAHALGVLYEAWAQLSYARWRRSRGWLDHLRALEVNMNLRGKAHSHINAVLVCEPGVDVDLLQAQLAERWRSLVKKLSPQNAPSLERGVELSEIHTDEAMQRVAKYATKLGETRGAVSECLDQRH